MKTSMQVLSGAFVLLAALATTPALAAPAGSAANGGGSVINQPGIGLHLTLPSPGIVVLKAKKVCAYDDLFFAGRYICWTGNTAIAQLPAAWNDRIESLKAYGGARITLCSNANYQGDCATFAADAPGVGIVLMDHASSLKIW